MSRASPNSVRSVNYATSPLLASKTPPWRSRLAVVLVGAAFLLLLARAVHLQLHTAGWTAQWRGEREILQGRLLEIWAAGAYAVL